MLNLSREDANYVGIHYENDVAANMKLVEFRVEIPWRLVSHMMSAYSIKRDNPTLKDKDITTILTLDNRAFNVEGKLEELSERRHEAIKLAGL